jgi:hypothetical protein
MNKPKIPVPDATDQSLQSPQENLMDHEYIPVGPLVPLTALIGDGPTRQ